MIPLNYHHLYYFYVTAKHSSVSKAAEELRVAQPSLSKQLKQLEAYFELNLFKKEGRRIVLTEEGHQILTYAKGIFELGHELVSEIKDGHMQGTQKVLIGVSSFIPKAFVDHFLKFIYRFFPGIYLVVVEKSSRELIQDLKNFRLDMVINDMPYQISPEEEMESTLLAKIPIVFCGTSEWVRKIKSIPKDLNNMPVFIPTSQSQVYSTLQEFFLTHKVKPHFCGEIQDVELVRRFVLEGYGVAPLNKFTVMNAPSESELKILDPKKNLKIYDTIYLITKKRKISHPVVNYVIENFKIDF